MRQIEQGQPGLHPLHPPRRAARPQINPRQQRRQQRMDAPIQHRMHPHPPRPQQGQIAGELNGIPQPLLTHHQKRLGHRAAAPNRHGLRPIRPHPAHLGENLGQQFKAHLIGVPGLLPEPSGKQRPRQRRPHPQILRRQPRQNPQSRRRLQAAPSMPGLLQQGQDGRDIGRLRHGANACNQLRGLGIALGGLIGTCFSR